MTFQELVTACEELARGTNNYSSNSRPIVQVRWGNAERGSGHHGDKWLAWSNQGGEGEGQTPEEAVRCLASVIYQNVMEQYESDRKRLEKTEAKLSLAKALVAGIYADKTVDP